MADKPLLDPTNDLVFKLLLTGPDSREVLRYVLEAVLRPTRPIADFTVADPARTGDGLDAKEIVFDVRVVLGDGTEIDVEMQSRPVPGLRSRLVYYAARGLTAQLRAGEDYRALRPSLVVAFLGYVELVEGPYHQRFDLRGVETGLPFDPTLAVHTIELPKVPPLDGRPGLRHDPLVVFSRFLACRSPDERRALASESAAMRRAAEILAHLSSDELVRRRAEDREARLLLDKVLRRQELEDAAAAAEAEGAARGREQALREVATRLAAAGVDAEMVQKVLESMRG